MRLTKRTLRWLSVLFVIIIMGFILTACEESTKPENQNEMGTISGTVTAPNKSPLSGVVVSIGSLSATTGSDGSFAIYNVPVAERVLVDYEKVGYISTQKVATVLANRTVNADVVMFTGSLTSFPNIATDLTLENSAMIQIPANAFVDGDGNPFTGNILAETRYFDPTDPAALAAFPGEFKGVQLDGTETAFESYGFISASFYDAAHPVEELQLATGKTCHLVVPIPTALLADAPATIPLWYYDTTTGKWMEQGSATKTGSTYEGNVSHFTYWNFDHSIQVTDQATLTGVVVLADSTHAAVGGAQVVATGVNYAGYTRSFTNSQGVYSITVKASSQVRVQAFSGNISTLPTDIINTPATNGSAEVDTLFISDLNFTITGTLVDAAGNPLSNAYGRIQQTNVPAGAYPFAGWINADANGVFTSSQTFAGAGSTITLQFNAFVMNSSVYSETINFLIPNPGDTYSFGNVTLAAGGKIKGRLKDNAGNYLNGGFIYWNQEGGSGATEVYFNSPVDSLGYFLIEGPPSTTLNNMVGSVQIDATTYTTGSRTLTFPASGATTDIGTLVVVPETRRK